MKNLLLSITLLSSLGVSAQLTASEEKEIQSIEQEIQFAKHDSVIVNSWIAWDNIIWRVDPELDFDLNKKVEELCQKNLKKSLSEAEKEFFSKNKAKALHNFGIVFYERGDYAKAVNYFSQSLKLKEELDDPRGEAASINNIGNIYLEQNNFEKAEEFYRRSLSISRTLEDDVGISSALSNIGLIYAGQKEYEKAIDHQTQSLEIRKKNQDKAGMAVCLSNIGQVYNEKGDHEQALVYYTEGLKLYQEENDAQGIAMSYSDFGLIYFKQGNHTKAIEFGKKSLALAQKRGTIMQESYTYKTLYQSYEETKDYKKVYEMHQFYIDIRGSLDSEENQKEMIRQEFQYSYDQKAAADSVKAVLAVKVKDASAKAHKKADDLKRQLEAKQERQQRTFLYGGLIIALLFGGFAFNRFRATSAHKRTIEGQKQLVDKAFNELEEKKTEILDSINYAKRIQNAILPSASVVKEYLKDSFILYKPKDIVAGDFYWLEFKDNKILFATADCTDMVFLGQWRV